MTDELFDQYYVRRRGKVEGPWGVERVKSEVKLRKLSRIHEISEDGKNWQRADKFAWLFLKKDIVDTAAVMQQPAHTQEPSSFVEPTIEPAVEPAISQPPVAGTYNAESAEPYVDQPIAESGNWYLAIGGQEVGSMSEIDVLQKINEQVVGPLDLAWCAGLPDWTQLQLLPEFSDCFRDPATEPQRTEFSSAAAYNGTESTFDDTDGQSVSVLAILSLVAGVLAIPLVAFGFNNMVLAITALVIAVLAFAMGLFALDQIAKSNGMLGGKGIAIAGSIVGVLAATVAVVFLSLLVVPLIQASEVTSG